MAHPHRVAARLTEAGATASRPAVVRHADWSVSAARRWVAEVCRGGDGWVLDAPRVVGDPATVLVAPGPLLVGLDVTIGLPRHYAARAGVDCFPAWLASLDEDRWRRFASVADVASEVSSARPFFPARPGGARQQDLVVAHGAVTIDDLRRACERRPPLARAACPLFWTLGANQVGRASLHAWETVLRPALREGRVALWPYAGALDRLVATRDVVVAEAYPAWMTSLLGLGPVAKRHARARAGAAAALITAAARLGVHLTQAAYDAVGEGCATEHAFDTVVGVLGLVHVLQEGPYVPAASCRDATTVEGWIAGVA